MKRTDYSNEFIGEEQVSYFYTKRTKQTEFFLCWKKINGYHSLFLLRFKIVLKFLVFKQKSIKGFTKQKLTKIKNFKNCIVAYKLILLEIGCIKVNLMNVLSTNPTGNSS